MPAADCARFADNHAGRDRLAGNDSQPARADRYVGNFTGYHSAESTETSHTDHRGRRRQASSETRLVQFDFGTSSYLFPSGTPLIPICTPIG